MIKPLPVKYWNNRPSDGIIVDWDIVRTEYRKITPKKYHGIVDQYKFENYGYNIMLSERTGYKTTQILLIALIAYRLYGVQLEYFRTTDDDIAPKKLGTLYNPIIENKYLEKIFGDEWTDIQYRGGFFRLIHRDPETGKPDNISSDYTTHVIANDQPDDYKSSYSTIRGDLIFYDEFVAIRSRPMAYEYFRQNLTTVLRKRLHGVIFMAANIINFNNDFYADFGIRRDLKKMDPNGDTAVIDKNGTIFYVQILKPDTSAAKKRYNTKYFGYADGRAAAITGGKWQMTDYPHINPEWADCKKLVQNYYIQHLGDLLRLTLCKPETMGIICLVTPATRIYDDSHIFTVGEIRDKRYIYKCGPQNEATALFWTLYKRNRWFYATNECGELVQAFIDAAGRV